MVRALAKLNNSLAPGQSHSDEQVINLWLRGKQSPHTHEAYTRDIQAFLKFVSKPLEHVTLEDIHNYADTLERLARASVSRKMAVVKSLFRFAHRTGYLRFNVTEAFELPKIQKSLAREIISERDAIRVLDKETNQRNHCLLRLLYVSGARVSEVCKLHWRDVQEGKGAKQILLDGKGNKERVMLLNQGMTAELVTFLNSERLKHNATYEYMQDKPVFSTRTGKPLRREQVFKIVKAAGKRAGIANLHPHSFRHAHVSHALDNGAPAHLVQRDVGHSSLATTTGYAHARPDDTSARFLPV